MNPQNKQTNKNLDCGRARITSWWAGFGPQARLSLHCGSSIFCSHTKTDICVPEAIFFPTLQWKTPARFEYTDNGHFLVSAVITHVAVLFRN